MNRSEKPKIYRYKRELINNPMNWSKNPRIDRKSRESIDNLTNRSRERESIDTVVNQSKTPWVDRRHPDQSNFVDRVPVDRFTFFSPIETIPSALTTLESGVFWAFELVARARSDKGHTNRGPHARVKTRCGFNRKICIWLHDLTAILSPLRAHPPFTAHRPPSTGRG